MVVGHWSLTRISYCDYLAGHPCAEDWAGHDGDMGGGTTWGRDMGVLHLASKVAF